MAKKLTKGDKVLLEVKHLHGIAADVMDAEGDQVVLRIAEGGFEGHIVAFQEDDLVLLDHPKVAKQHKANVARKVTNAKQDGKEHSAEEVLAVHSGDRLAWNYQD